MPQMRMSFAGSSRSARMSSTASGPPPTSTARRSSTPAFRQLATSRPIRMRSAGSTTSPPTNQLASQTREKSSPHLQEEEHEREAAEDRGPDRRRRG